MFDITFQFPGVQWYFYFDNRDKGSSKEKKTLFFLIWCSYLRIDLCLFIFLRFKLRPLQHRNLGYLQMRLHLRDTFKLVFFLFLHDLCFIRFTSTCINFANKVFKLKKTPLFCFPCNSKDILEIFILHVMYEVLSFEIIKLFKLGSIHLCFYSLMSNSSVAQ